MIIMIIITIIRIIITLITVFAQHHSLVLRILSPAAILPGLNDLVNLIVSILDGDADKTLLGGQVEPPDSGVGEATLHEDPVTPVHPGLVHLRTVGAVIHLVLHQVWARAQSCGSCAEPLPVRQSAAVVAPERTPVPLCVPVPVPPGE